MEEILVVDIGFFEIVSEEIHAVVYELRYLMTADKSELNILKHTRERTLLLILVTERI